MDEQYEILGAEILLLIRKLAGVSRADFLSFVEEFYGREEAYRIRGVFLAAKRRSDAVQSFSEPASDRAWEIYSREIRAIISDTSFLPTKTDLLNFLDGIVGEIPDSLVRKAGRDAVVDWAVKRIANFPEKERKARYSSIRQSFLRRRDSSLSDWADILSKPEK
ncbi:hypothetical protein MMG85_15135 [Pseudoxanthomonas sp. LH2527]|uniref:hypothetical protein n=1 Tax=Pseudoxanthomonas sp. LH2527 TaxID=2923249 RepID=UPI001F12DB25|nr:hypothetical protein [Pseudoxanthomonas sp. LH2527]MCH6484884.1 hypothetical protein [Pseudoxanthomonas sp. LH2527]